MYGASLPFDLHMPSLATCTVVLREDTLVCCYGDISARRLQGQNGQNKLKLTMQTCVSLYKYQVTVVMSAQSGNGGD